MSEENPKRELEVQIATLHWGLLRLLNKTKMKMYRHTLERLKRLNPTLAEISELVHMTVSVLKDMEDPTAALMEEIAVIIDEANEAVNDGNESTVTDCAYHLEDTIARVNDLLKSRLEPGAL